MFKVFYDCQAKREVDGVALLAFSLATRQGRQQERERVLLLLFQLLLLFLSLSSPAAASSPGAVAAAANRKKQSTRVFKINCYDGFC